MVHAGIVVPQVTKKRPKRMENLRNVFELNQKHAKVPRYLRVTFIQVREVCTCPPYHRMEYSQMNSKHVHRPENFKFVIPDDSNETSIWNWVCNTFDCLSKPVVLPTPGCGQKKRIKRLSTESGQIRLWWAQPDVLSLRTQHIFSSTFCRKFVVNGCDHEY